MSTHKMIITVVLALGVLASILYFNSQKALRTAIGEKVEVQTTMNKEEKAKRYPIAKEITTPDGFINTGGKPITIGEFTGTKVVLLDIWTYSCINCQRTTPYLNAWYEKYSAGGGSASGGKDKGLVIIGLHTPEFEFEKVYQNVLEATKRLGIKYPVVLDNDFSTWNAYQNRYWPRKYLIDIDGYIVYDHIGEGAYEETEKKIQELLEERSVALGVKEDIAEDTSRPAQAIETNFSRARSPEIYFGAARNTSFGNGKPNTIGLQSLSEPKDIKKNLFYLSGNWNFEDEFAENQTSQAKIIFRYQAKNVYFVARSDSDIKIKILNDGTETGEQTIKSAETYRLIADSDYSDHTLEIIIEDPGLQAFTFTFG